MTSEHPGSEPVVDYPPPDDNRARGLIRLGLLAAVAGALTGLVGGLFRLVLQWAWLTWYQVLEWTQDLGGWRILVPVLAAAVAAGLARALVRIAPEAAGSGVQRVEAMMRHQDAPPGLRVVWVKFIGATLSLGVGMLLGREGPMVQMGAAVGGEVGRRARLDAVDQRNMAAAMAGAGLGVAFSAPVAGVVFVLEELARSVRTRLVVTSLVGAAVALAVALPLVGNQPVLPVPAVDRPIAWQLLLYVLLGVCVGWLGAQYNKIILLMVDVNERLSAWPPEARAAIVGAIVGLLGVVSPFFVGSGEQVTVSLLTIGLPLSTLALVLLVRWIMSPMSYCVGVPGGLFAPMLAIGALLGGGGAAGLNALVPDLGLPVEAFAIVGMSTFFAAVVRAPITGVILTMEMTATTALVLPMLLAAALAVLTCTLLRSAPIYDSLRLRMDEAPAPSPAA